MKKYIIYTLLITGITACMPSNPKEKINKGGEVVGEAVGEFMSGVGSGVEKAFDPKIELSESFKEKGLKVGEMQLSGSEGTDNLLSVYLIFDKDFKDDIMIKAYNENNKEMGRSKLAVEAKKGDASFHDFKFDQRTNIDNNSKLVFE